MPWVGEQFAIPSRPLPMDGITASPLSSSQATIGIDSPVNQPTSPTVDLEKFIADWQSSAAAERANYALFLTQLCTVLGVPQPEPTKAEHAQNAYVFERDVHFEHGDGSTSIGRIDLYKRSCFVLEAKQGSDAARAEEEAAKALAPTGTKSTKKKGTAVRGTKAWDDAMVRARGQAEAYAKALPASEGWPPFLIVVDVGHSIELYNEFTRAGKAYVPFPDPQSFRIKLDDLRDEKIRKRLAAVWTDPLSLDPSRRSAKVTRELAERLAALARLLEQAGHQPGNVAKFLMRCLFTMFAEDVELIPRGSFKDLLESLKDEPQNFQPMVEALWQTMNSGGFSTILRKQILRFNGGLFAESEALPLDKPMLALLIEAAKSDWADVEPAIFGTLLERALDTHERHKLGAHYTPRAYVERLVMPTVIEPLREDWKNSYAAAVALAKSGDLEEAQKTVREFHDTLCKTRVLDPACGSGNFLYVTLEHMKRLEGEVLNALRELGEDQRMLDITEVDPHQFLGIEINPRAAAIADLVLWIGYLQWHFRTRGKAQPAEPIIRNYKNIECRDAVLAWDHTEPLLDADGKPVTRWDGRTTKTHPVTSEQVPDESARVEVLKYINPRKAEWPEAEYIVGNPPFLGKHFLLSAFGDGYVGALRRVYADDIPDSADFVMYWWGTAANMCLSHKVRRFGFVTTNSITQTFNRRIVARALANGIKLLFAIADHPWVTSADGAAVRISMTTGGLELNVGQLGVLKCETQSSIEDAKNVDIKIQLGDINSDLTTGADCTSCKQLISNVGITSNGVMLGNRGFLVTPEEKGQFESSVLHRIVNGSDILRTSRNVFVIDFTGYSKNEAQVAAERAYHRLLTHVKPERDSNRRLTRKERWWLFSEAMPQLRAIKKGLSQYIVTPETAKHRVFVAIESDILAEHPLIGIGLDDHLFLGVLSSRIHVCFALAAGGRMGVGNDPRYNKTLCFDPFPFPVCSEESRNRIQAIAKELDAHRKRQQALHPKLTLTETYNVLEKLRSGEALSAKEKVIHGQGLVSVLKQIHDELDAAVFAAYGWPTTLTDEEILERLVALNAERAAEEARGIIRWLRPEFQAPKSGEKQASLELEDDADEADTKPAKGKKTKATTKPAAAKPASKQPWPKERAERTKAVQAALAAATSPVTPEDLAKQFTRGNPEQIEEILDALADLGFARKSRGKFSK